LSLENKQESFKQKFNNSLVFSAKKLLLVKLVYPNKDGFVHPRYIDTVSKENRNFKEQDVGELFFSQPLPAKFN
jgi:hypothetical protein